MTEEEWEACRQPKRMLKYLLREARNEEWQVHENAYLHRLMPRRWRLIRAAFLRRLPPRRGPYLATADKLERWADAAPNTVDWVGEWRAQHRFQGGRYNDYWVIGILRADSAVPVAAGIRLTISRHGASQYRGMQRELTRRRLLTEEELIQAELIRCIFGNPFRPVMFAPEWRSATAVSLAGAIYADRAFDRLPVLADALEEAGCDSPDVLAHCRGPGPHARGCWVVDGVLGRG